LSVEAPLKNVKSEIVIDLDTPLQAETVLNSVLPEIESSPSERSSMKINVQGSSIFLKINSNDAASFRASLNSSLRWILLSLEVLDLQKNNL
jgi:KEOPS complex subunit Pcc1